MAPSTGISRARTSSTPRSSCNSCAVHPSRGSKSRRRGARPGQPFAFYVVDAYLSREHLDDVEGSGPLIGLPSDAARSGKGVKSAYRQVAESMIRLFESNLSGPDAHEQALVFVSLCVGGMVLARGIDDDSLGSELRDAAQSHILKMAGWKNGRKQKSLEATK
jgi:hypothetical protein